MEADPSIFSRLERGDSETRDGIRFVTPATDPRNPARGLVEITVRRKPFEDDDDFEVRNAALLKRAERQIAAGQAAPDLWVAIRGHGRTADGSTFVVMDRFEEPLAPYIERGPVPEVIGPIVDSVLQGLAALESTTGAGHGRLHQHNILVRDAAFALTDPDPAPGPDAVGHDLKCLAEVIGGFRPAPDSSWSRYASDLGNAIRTYQDAIDAMPRERLIRRDDERGPGPPPWKRLAVCAILVAVLLLVSLSLFSSDDEIDDAKGRQVAYALMLSLVPRVPPDYSSIVSNARERWDSQNLNLDAAEAEYDEWHRDLFKGPKTISVDPKHYREHYKNQLETVKLLQKFGEIPGPACDVLEHLAGADGVKRTRKSIIDSIQENKLKDTVRNRLDRLFALDQCIRDREELGFIYRDADSANGSGDHGNMIRDGVIKRLRTLLNDDNGDDVCSAVGNIARLQNLARNYASDVGSVCQKAEGWLRGGRFEQFDVVAKDDFAKHDHVKNMVDSRFDSIPENVQRYLQGAESDLVFASRGHASDRLFAKLAEKVREVRTMHLPQAEGALDEAFFEALDEALEEVSRLVFERIRDSFTEIADNLGDVVSEVAPRWLTHLVQPEAPLPELGLAMEFADGLVLASEMLKKAWDDWDRDEKVFVADAVVPESAVQDFIGRHGGFRMTFLSDVPARAQLNIAAMDERREAIGLIEAWVADSNPEMAIDDLVGQLNQPLDGFWTWEAGRMASAAGLLPEPPNVSAVRNLISVGFRPEDEDVRTLVRGSDRAFAWAVAHVCDKVSGDDFFRKARPLSEMGDRLEKLDDELKKELGDKWQRELKSFIEKEIKEIDSQRDGDTANKSLEVLPVADSGEIIGEEVSRRIELLLKWLGGRGTEIADRVRRDFGSDTIEESDLQRSLTVIFAVQEMSYPVGDKLKLVPGQDEKSLRFVVCSNNTNCEHERCTEFVFKPISNDLKEGLLLWVLDQEISFKQYIAVVGRYPLNSLDNSPNDKTLLWPLHLVNGQETNGSVDYAVLPVFPFSKSLDDPAIGLSWDGDRDGVGVKRFLDEVNGEKESWRVRVPTISEWEQIEKEVANGSESDGDPCGDCSACRVFKTLLDRRSDGVAYLDRSGEVQPGESQDVVRSSHFWSRAKDGSLCVSNQTVKRDIRGVGGGVLELARYGDELYVVDRLRGGESNASPETLSSKDFSPKELFFDVGFRVVFESRRIPPRDLNVEVRAALRDDWKEWVFRKRPAKRVPDSPCEAGAA